MASPGPSTPPSSRSRPQRTPAAPNAGALPREVLFDVLVRLPAKELCRLSVVCRTWRSLTSDPVFVGRHAARHPDPHFLATFWDDDETYIHVLDLSGNAVKRIPNASHHQLLPTRLDLACAATVSSSCRVFDPATGSVRVLPESPAAEHLGHENLVDPCTYYAFGRISTTGEDKVLRVFDRPSLAGDNQRQLFEVLTVNGASSSGSGHRQWRARRSHDYLVEGRSAIVAGGVVYFMVDRLYSMLVNSGANPGINHDSIISFDLETEEWREVVQGPISGIFFTGEYDNNLERYRELWSHLVLADLRGSLVLAHYRNRRHIMDLWLLRDFGNGLWVKEYSIQTQPIIRNAMLSVKSLFMLDDGRLVICWPGSLLIYDPRTNTSAKVDMKERHLNAVALYTGNLLSLQAGDMM